MARYSHYLFSACLMASTRPSIMSDGATMSQPARAKATAWAASSGNEALLLMLPSASKKINLLYSPRLREGMSTFCLPVFVVNRLCDFN